jgi:hypothetical protein
VETRSKQYSAAVFAGFNETTFKILKKKFLKETATKGFETSEGT